MKRVQKKPVAPFGSLFVVECEKLDSVVGGAAGCTGGEGYTGSNGTGYDTSGAAPEASDLSDANVSSGYVGFISGVWDWISK